VYIFVVTVAGRAGEIIIVYIFTAVCEKVSPDCLIRVIKDICRESRRNYNSLHFYCDL
jgi:hypothetical protein